jgi:opacity protein-like surface antigen
MNALLKISLLGLALVSTASMAGNFSGPEAGASVTMNGGSTKFKSDGEEVTLGGESIGFKLHGGYGLDVSKDTVVLLGLDYNVTDLVVGNILGENFKTKNSWSLSVAPGMLLNDKTLAYVKLSYEAGNLSLKVPSASVDKSISGFGYGIGLRTEINKTTFFETEIKQVNYKKSSYKSGGDTADITPAVTVGSVGVVFKF